MAICYNKFITLWIEWCFVLIQIAICDDRNDHLHRIVEAVKLYFEKNYNGNFSIMEFKSAKSLTSWVERFGDTLDILILDIQLDGNADGITLAQKYSQKYNQIKTIFITGFIEKASEICEAPFLYFLLKPLDEKKLTRALEKAVCRIQEEARTALALTSGGEVHRIAPQEIIYIESNGRQIKIHFSNGLDSVYYKKISEIAGELPSCFYRCHNSYIVNLDYVEKLEWDGFLIRNTKEKIPVPRHKHTEAKEQYLLYLIDQ